MTMSVCMFTYERTYIHTHTYVRILMYVCMFKYVHTCLHRLAYVRISMYIISTCTLAYMDAYTHTRLQSLCIRTHVRTYTHIHAKKCTKNKMISCTHTHVLSQHRCTYVRRHQCKRTETNNSHIFIHMPYSIYT